MSKKVKAEPKAEPKRRRAIVSREEAINKYAGAKFRELRAAKGISAREVALQVGVSYQQVNKYSTSENRMSIGMASALTAAIGHTVQDILPAEDVAEAIIGDKNHMRLVSAFTGLSAESQELVLALVEQLRTPDLRVS